MIPVKQRGSKSAELGLSQSARRVGKGQEGAVRSENKRSTAARLSKSLFTRVMFAFHCRRARYSTRLGKAQAVVLAVKHGEVAAEERVTEVPEWTAATAEVVGLDVHHARCPVVLLYLKEDTNVGATS